MLILLILKQVLYNYIYIFNLVCKILGSYGGVDRDSRLLE
jgi:hypothetical protein